MNNGNNDIKREVLNRIESFGLSSEYVINQYSEPHRYYHTFNHIESIYTKMIQDDALTSELFLALVFHDIIYDPKSHTNERDSADVFMKMFTDSDEAFKRRVKNYILDTAEHTPRSKESEILCKYDLDILSQPLSTLIEYEKNIFLEYQFVDIQTYITKRSEALASLSKKHSVNLQSLIEYVQNRSYNLGVYAGSFNPLTIGHKNIFEKAEKIFDKVILLNAQNQSKETSEKVEYLDFKYKQVDYLEYPLTTDYLKSIAAPNISVTLVRGLRNASDLQYEQNQLSYMKVMYPELKIVYIPCDKEYEHISCRSYPLKGILTTNFNTKK